MSYVSPDIKAAKGDVADSLMEDLIKGRAGGGAIFHSRYERYQKDPIGFGKDILGHTYTEDVQNLMMAVLENDVVVAQSANAVGKCLKQGERVPLADGRFVKVEDLSGQIVPMVGFDEATGRQDIVLAAVRPNGRKPVYRVESSSGRQIYRTPNHLLYCAKAKSQYPNTKCSSLIPEPSGWVQVKDIDVNTDLVAVPLGLRSFASQRYDESKLKLLAYLLADGGTTIAINFTKPDGPVKDEFLSIVEELGCFTRPAKGNPYGICVSSVLLNETNGYAPPGANEVLNLARQWGIFGKKSNEKSFPSFVWQLPDDQLALFLNRFFACDGYAWVSKPSSKSSPVGRIAVTLASEQMVRDVEMACLRLGITGYFRHRKVRYNDEKDFDAWEFQVYKPSDVLRFIDVVGIYGKEKQLKEVYDAAIRFTGHKGARWPYRNIPQGYKWDRVKSLEYVGDFETYNISVPKRHTFLTTFVEHNSFCAADLALWWFRCFPAAEVYMTAAPPEKNLRRILWDKVVAGMRGNADVFDGSTISGMTVKSSTVPPVASIDGVPIPGQGMEHERESRFGGKHAPYLLFIVDEGDAVPDAVYKGIESCTSGGMARLLVMYNPRFKHGHVYSMVKHQEAKVIQLSAFNHPNVVTGKDLYPGAVTRERTAWRVNAWCRYLKEDDDYNGSDVFELPEYLVDYVAKRKDGTFYPPLRVGRYRVEEPQFFYMVLGQYPTRDENVLIEEALIEAAVNRWNDYVDENGEHPQQGVDGRAGLDPGELGSDKTALCARWGSFVRGFTTWGGVDIGVTNERAELICREDGYKQVFVDANGFGAGVAPYLRRVGINGIAIKTQVSATEFCEQGEFSRMRDQLLWQIRVFLKENPASMLPDDDELREELLALKYTMDARGRIKITDKETLREILKRSPNKADALALTFAPGKSYTGEVMNDAKHQELKDRYSAPLPGWYRRN
jgi:intein/homing endonuclease